MKRYPKGCRFIVALGGEISQRRKMKRPCDIHEVGRSAGPWREAKLIAVQPRGKLKWLLFRVHHEYASLIDRGDDPEPMLVKWILHG